jgi:hypothetical protein
VITPTVGHPTCDLDLQQRVSDARIEAMVRSVGRRNRRCGRLRSLTRLARRHDRPSSDHAMDFRPGGGDVWHALRY